MKRALTRIAAASAVSLLALAPVVAEEISVVGSWSGLPLHKQFEAPFWTKTLPEASGGDITVQLTTHDQMGIKGGDVFRMLGDGVFDVGMTVADYAVGDAPELEGLDVPLVATTPEQAEAMVEAARPMVEEIFANRFNAKLLAIAPYPPQVVFCKGDLSSLADLEGKKIRGSGRMTTKFLEALGAEGVNVGFSEVPGALERGVIDCAVTGSGSGYSAGWWEVTDTLMTLPLGGWDSVVTAMNMDRWNSLSDETKILIQEQITTKFEAPAWDLATGSLETDIACLTGKGECSAGDSASLKLVEPSEADIAKARAILTDTVLPEWAERAGDDWAKRWNESVGEVVGVSIPLK
ncbi:TRAP transporter substrate-binding protein [Stappia sp. ES.058]|uniref:TRAP transporter substrate-binding protein n=1 Tax=Stappia sp. ES.058 TaxID=1881061 RepID=UPI00087BD82D|nr:TRAP transporter substrate-binding protein [Stappia sp. ES.058]SDU33416.1 TRAP-type C4-dicarboxylate transport system, substrate-binding protein [Stappia sp. ES.058]